MLISAEQVRAIVEDVARSTLIFDVRHSLADPLEGLRDYQKGHIQGAFHLDVEGQLSGVAGAHTGRHPLPSYSDFASLMRAHGLTPLTQVVIYDGGNGMFAARLWWMLRWLGHESAAVLDGGWSAWLRQKGAVQRADNKPSLPQAQLLQSGGYNGTPRMATVDVHAVLNNLRQPRFTVVDARSSDRFRGDTEPIDPVAGHIPGALNRPSSLNLQADGHFKPASQLRSEFEALLQGVPAAQVVHQCGSGVTACHNLLAMELAGLPGSALYPGSWSQWCSDAARPVARGET